MSSFEKIKDETENKINVLKDNAQDLKKKSQLLAQEASGTSGRIKSKCDQNLQKLNDQINYMHDELNKHKTNIIQNQKELTDKQLDQLEVCLNTNKKVLKNLEDYEKDVIILLYNVQNRKCDDKVVQKNLISLNSAYEDIDSKVNQDYENQDINATRDIPMIIFLSDQINVSLKELIQISNNEEEALVTVADRGMPGVHKIGEVSLAEQNNLADKANKWSTEVDHLQEENIRLNQENRIQHDDLVKLLDEKIQETRPKRVINQIKHQIGNQRGETFGGQEDGNGIFESLALHQKHMGEFREGVPHGDGMSIWFDDNQKHQEVFDGQFRGGTRNGKGVYLYKSGNVYTGEWKNAKRNGLGTMRMPNGDMYRGEWIDGKPRGKGLFIFSSGSKFLGTFIDGKPEGEGNFFWKDGTKRRGQWENGKRVHWFEQHEE